jgi:hypothetical protein
MGLSKECRTSMIQIQDLLQIKKFIMSIYIALLQYSSHVENGSTLNTCVWWEDTE